GIVLIRSNNQSIPGYRHRPAEVIVNAGGGIVKRYRGHRRYAGGEVEYIRTARLASPCIVPMMPDHDAAAQGRHRITKSATRWVGVAQRGDGHRGRRTGEIIY